MNENFKKLTNFTFGSTSAIITNISIIVGLGSTISKTGIIGSLLVIAVADNISDSLGIHIYKESENSAMKESIISTLGNFFARFIISLTFIAIIMFLSIKMAEITAILWGLFLLSVISYLIARKNNNKPILEVLRHIAVAVIVIALSKYAGYLISNKF
jgi:VIT1/CCC1 family predicted Fe2+/Mn2+ transporter